MKRQEVDKKMQKAKDSIQVILQRLHNETGLIPIEINFKSLNTQTGKQYNEKVNAIVIRHVEITANF